MTAYVTLCLVIQHSNARNNGILLEKDNSDETTKAISLKRFESLENKAV